MTTKMKRMIIIFFVAVVTLLLPKVWQLPLLLVACFPYKASKGDVLYFIEAGVLLIVLSYFNLQFLYLNIGQAIAVVIGWSIVWWLLHRLNTQSDWVLALIYFLGSLLVIGFGSGVTGLVAHTLTGAQFIPYVAMTIQHTVIVSAIVALGMLLVRRFFK